MEIIKYKKVINGKYKIILSDNIEISLYEDLILKYNLLITKKIDENLLNQLIEENEFYEIYNSCLKHISAKIRSIKEMNIFLNKKNIDENISKKIINKLVKNNYLSDELYTKYYILDKINLTNDGPYKIINNLKQNDIDNYLIDKYLKDYDEVFNEKLNKLIKKYIKANHSQSGNILKNKIYNNLINLGYDKSMIIDNLNNYKFKNENIKKVYDSLYKKYQKKYNEDELKYIISQKLYQKGYTKEDIDNM